MVVRGRAVLPAFRQIVQQNLGGSAPPERLLPGGSRSIQACLAVVRKNAAPGAFRFKGHAQTHGLCRAWRARRAKFTAELRKLALETLSKQPKQGGKACLISQKSASSPPPSTRRASLTKPCGACLSRTTPTLNILSWMVVPATAAWKSSKNTLIAWHTGRVRKTKGRPTPSTKASRVPRARSWRGSIQMTFSIRGL